MDYGKVLPQSLIVFFLLWSTIEGSDKASPFIPDQIPLSIHIDNTNKLYNFLVREYALSPSSIVQEKIFPLHLSNNIYRKTTSLRYCL